MFSSTSSTDNPEKMDNQPKAVWAVFFTAIIAFMSLGLVDPILPAIANQLGATPSQVTLLFTTYFAVMGVAMLITGAVSSRLGIKRTMLLGVIIIAVFSTLGGLSSNIWTIDAMRGVWGLGNALFVATALTSIILLSENGVSKSVILYEAAIGLGLSTGPLLGGLLGEISWRYPFIGVGFLMTIAFIFLLISMPNEQESDRILKKKTSLLDPFRAMKHHKIMILGLTAALYNFGFFTLLAYAPFVIGLDAHGIGFVFIGWGILLAFTSVFMAPRLQKRFGIIKSMCTMLTIFAIVLLIMGIYTSTQWIIIFSIIFSGALIGNINTLITTAVMQATNIEGSTVSAAYSFLRFIGAAIAPYLAGVLAVVYSPHIPFLVGGCFVFASAIFILLNRHQLKTSYSTH
jgi:ACDE family multidrug resistance protein